MKKYMKNKNFIPEKFYNRKELNKNKKEKILLMLFVIVNLILVPITTKSIREIKTTTMVSNDGINNSKSRKIDANSINIWIESIIEDDIDEANINKSNGDVTVNNLAEIEELSSNKFINIREFNLKDDGKYNLIVDLNE